ncbi:MAG TPA: lactonase family protein [Chitinophagaceae bacterium]|nr:lactonase family protein [Chitinophagaceae bacterium]
MKSLMTALLLLLVSAAFAQHSYLLIGTYTNGKSEGIYVYDFNSSNGKGVYKSKIKAVNPSFLAVSPTKQYVYAAFEDGNGKGSVGAYRFNKKDGSLSFINQQSSGGDNPCYVAEDKTGKWVTVANYSGGSLAVFPVKGNGALGASTQLIQHNGSSVNKQRQEKAHVHCTYFSADNKYLFVPDLGMDKLMLYTFNSRTGALKEATPAYLASPDSGGPRHITFSPNQQYAYLMEELKGTVVVYRYQQGKLTQVQTISAAAPGFQGFMGSADIHTSADGKFLYCSNRGDANTISIFKINATNGKLTAVGQQSTLGIAPRNFSLDPSGNYLLVANQNSDNIVVFKRNKITGLLTDSGERIEVGNPVCLIWIAQ